MRALLIQIGIKLSIYSHPLKCSLRALLIQIGIKLSDKELVAYVV